MPLFYKAQQASLESKDGKKKWHPRLVKVGKPVTTQMVAKKVADLSSLAPGDVHNAIRTMATVIGEFLSESRSVNLDGLGTFTMICGSQGNGVDKPEDVNPSQINNLKVHFTPSYTVDPTGNRTRAMFDSYEFVRYDAPKEESSSGGGPGANVEPDDGYIDPTA
jgi:predicted histone-like DNA-binding protein